MMINRKNILSALLLCCFLSVSSVSAELSSLQTGCSKTTLQQGDLCYPPSRAFIEVLQRSGYLAEPQTQRFLRQSPALMYYLLSPYYTVQRNGTSCSLATATMVLNAVRDLQQHCPLEKPATQNEVLEQVNDPLWYAATTDEGPGVTLEQYTSFLRKMFAAYGVQDVSVEGVYVENQSDATLQKIHEDLLALADEKEVTTFLLLDFDVEIFMQVPMVCGHISPVGAYDPKTGLVLVLDVDRQWSGPYWIPEKTVVKGLNTLDVTEGLTVPTYRGYVKVRVKNEG